MVGQQKRAGMWANKGKNGLRLDPEVGTDLGRSDYLNCPERKWGKERTEQIALVLHAL